MCYRWKVVLFAIWLSGSFVYAQEPTRAKSEEAECPTYASVMRDACRTYNEQFKLENIFEMSELKPRHGRTAPVQTYLCKEPLEVTPALVPGRIRDAFLNKLFPLPLAYSNEAGEIHSYPGLFNRGTGESTCPSGALCQIPSPIKRKGVPQKILHSGHSVGRLALVPKSYKVDHEENDKSYENQPYGYTQPYFWGSTFAIAPGVIATSCHQLEPLITKDGNTWKLNQDGEQRLIVDFGWQSNKYRKSREWEIEPEFVWGYDIDVALLFLRQRKQYPFPEALPLYNGPEKPLYDVNHFLALVGHADLNHFMDSKAERIYRVFEEDADSNAPEDDEFVILDHLVKLPACGDRPYDYYLHWASTTTGESGSVLMDLQSYPQGTDNFNVVAMHVCCSEYFPKPKGNPPQSELPCKGLTRTFYNQAVPSWEILQDPSLCQALKKRDPTFQCSGHR